MASFHMGMGKKVVTAILISTVALATVTEFQFRICNFRTTADAALVPWTTLLAFLLTGPCTRIISLAEIPLTGKLLR